MSCSFFYDHGSRLYELGESHSPQHPLLITHCRENLFESHHDPCERKSGLHAETMRAARGTCMNTEIASLGVPALDDISQ